MLTLASKLKRDDAGKAGRASGAPESSNRVSIRDRLLTKGTAVKEIPIYFLALLMHYTGPFVHVLTCAICTTVTPKWWFILLFRLLPSFMILLKSQPLVLSWYTITLSGIFGRKFISFPCPEDLFASTRPFVCMSHRSTVTIRTSQVQLQSVLQSFGLHFKCILHQRHKCGWMF